MGGLELGIIAGVFGTSVLSGFLGMAGGMILMAFFTMILPLKLAMILHGISQLTANGFRAGLHRRHIEWPLLGPYVVGAVLAFATFRYLNYVPSKATLYLMLGSFPLVSAVPSLASKFNIMKRGRALLCGVSVNAALLTAGASGSVLDIFFINSPLTRHQIIATKAITQSIGHTVKLIYYFSMMSSMDAFLELPLYIYPAVVLSACLGTRAGKIILDHLSEKNFRKTTAYVIYAMAALLIYKGLMLSL